MKNSELSNFIHQWADAWESSGRENPEEHLLSFYTDDCFYSDPELRNGIAGKGILRPYLKKLFLYNPNWKWEILEIIPTQKGCVVKWKANIPVNNEMVVEIGVDIIEVKDGLIHRYEAYFDRHNWLSKLLHSGNQ